MQLPLELPLLHLANELSKWFIHPRIRENRLFIESIDLSTVNFVKSRFSTKVNLEQSVFSLDKLAKTRSWLGQNCDNQSLHRSRNIRFPSVLRNRFSDRRLLEIVMSWRSEPRLDYSTGEFLGTGYPFLELPIVPYIFVP